MNHSDFWRAKRWKSGALAIVIVASAPLTWGLWATSSPVGKKGSEPQSQQAMESGAPESTLAAAGPLNSAGSPSAWANESPPEKAWSGPTAPPTQSPAAAFAPRQVGSEGYGPSILAAQGAKPVDAHWAAEQIARCKSVDRDLELVYRLRAENTNPNRATAWDQTLDWMAAEQRRCQTVTPDMDQLRPGLLLKAVLGGESAAVVSYLNSVEANGGVPAEHWNAVVQALRTEGVQGNSGALFALANGPANYSESPQHRAAYKAAYKVISEAQPDGIRKVLTTVLNSLGVPESEWGTFDFFQSPKLDQQSQQLAAQIIDNFRNRQPKKQQR